MIIKKTLNEQIYAMLKEEILTNQIEEGELLVNKDLQERFGVSSSPVRDAINRLNANGLISSINRTGAEVTTFDYEKIKEINELMSTITIGAIWLCKNKGIHAKELIEDLEKYVKLQHENIDNDKYLYYDYCFHKTFFNHSENNELKNIFKQYNALFEMAVRSLHRKRDSQDLRMIALEQHRDIISSIETESIVEISSKIIEHYDEATFKFKELYEGKIKV